MRRTATLQALWRRIVALWDDYNCHLMPFLFWFSRLIDRIEEVGNNVFSIEGSNMVNE